MRKLLDMLLGRQRITVTPDQRVLVLRRGRIAGVLGPGVHHLPRFDTELEWHMANDEPLVTEYETALIEGHPEIAAEHLHVVRTGASEIAVVEHDGRVVAAVRPDRRVAFWRDAGRWTHALHDAAATVPVEAALARRVRILGLGYNRVAETVPLQFVEVPAGHTALVFVDGAQVAEHGAGTHAYWAYGRKVEARVVDMRRTALDVSGQEILTRDRVSVRVNLAAEYRVTDARLAVTGARDFTQALYREVQFAFRRTLGEATLDELIERRVDVNAEAAAHVREQMARLGVSVEEIALKDVILPGEIRDILNGVVAAEKEAEANVLRRREETNATRSLLNTAKVMAENPVMLRLKELEALETISGRVEHLTVHNGTDGLLNGVVRLQD